MGVPRSIRLAIWLFLLFGIELSLSVGAETPKPLRLTQLDHKTWTMRDGAPTAILEIAQDHDGTLWLAGHQGIYQFDGLHFKEFHAPVGEPGLPAGGYGSIFVARNGDVWAGTLLHGIARIRGGHVRFFDEHDGFPTLTVMEITEGPDGSVWAIVHGRLMVFDGTHWTDGGFLGGIPNEGGVRALFFDHDGTQWVSTGRSVYYRSRNQRKFSRTDVDFGRGNDSGDFVESTSGELWLAIASTNPTSSTEFRQIDVPGHRVTEPIVIHLPFLVHQVTLASDGSLWATGSDLNRFEPVTSQGKQSFSRETFGTADGLTSRVTNAILEDRNGDIWLGTENGIERFQNPVLIKYVDRPLNPANLGLARDAQGTIWIGSERAPLLSVRNGETHEHGPALSSASILFPDSRHAIWIKTDDGIVRAAQDRVTKVDLPKGVQVWAPRQFFEGTSGELDVSLGAFGVFRFDDGKWSKMDLPNQPKENPLSFFVDKHGRIWIGYFSGKVGMVDISGGYVLPVGKDADLSSVETFTESSEGLLCGGTNGIAILRGHRFEILPTADPSAITGISGIVESANGDIWLNGIHGVSRIAFSDFRAAVLHGVAMPTQLYTQTEIAGPAANHGFPTAVTDASGRIWFNTSGLIAYVDPEHIPRNTLPPTLVISDVEGDGRPVGKQEEVKADTSTVRIPFFGANLFAPEKVKYMYWLHGVDKTWQDVGRRTEAVYTHLAPGKYLFEVKATNGEGVWSAPVSTRFTVLPTFYQTIWFKLLCALMGVLLLWLGLTLRVRYITVGIRQRVEERANERVRIARELHDTLLQSVQGLLLNFHAAAQRVPAEHESKQALEKALASADRVILEGRDRVNRLRSGHLKNGQLEPSIRELIDEMATRSKMQFGLETTGTEQPLDPEVMDEVYFITREALANSFRHSGASQVVVALGYEEDRFRLECHDNGRGFSAEEFHEYQANGHWGIRGMSERAQRIGADLSLKSSPGEGVRVSIVVPAVRAYVRNHRFRSLFRRPSTS
jgi:ligand-binding sensor domain-containing protein